MIKLSKRKKTPQKFGVLFWGTKKALHLQGFTTVFIVFDYFYFGVLFGNCVFK